MSRIIYLVRYISFLIIGRYQTYICDFRYILSHLVNALAPSAQNWYIWHFYKIEFLACSKCILLSAHYVNTLYNFKIDWNIDKNTPIKSVQFPRKTGISAVWLFACKTGISALLAFLGKTGIRAYNYCVYSNRCAGCLSGTKGVHLLFSTHLYEQFDNTTSLKRAWKLRKLWKETQNIP